MTWLTSFICKDNCKNEFSIGAVSSLCYKHAYMLIETLWPILPVNPSSAKPPLKFIGGLDKLGLTHWGGVTHICISKLIIIGSDNGLAIPNLESI